MGRRGVKVARTDDVAGAGWQRMAAALQPEAAGRACRQLRCSLLLPDQCASLALPLMPPAAHPYILPQRLWVQS